MIFQYHWFNSKIIINQINNISKFNTLRFSLCLLYIYFWQGLQIIQNETHMMNIKITYEYVSLLNYK